ncbi:GGDEF domain-containing protein [Rivibacter subsaxonicus]|uniref:diguanylate cyclase n=1 Tax=Rivibacter subsaxonicus TaxID=457575 RepID=A0A4Q7VWG5_9BURK|nr:GGDEF domain-containing protein [Rivibacter subsaxonicus]RZU01051.1 diguanylate cyclase (GGDEF)-like protein [Rivibacter subsaxonicus]
MIGAWRSGLGWRLAALCLVALGAWLPAHAAGPDWQQRLDHWVRAGFDHPDDALAALQRDELWLDTPEWARLAAQGSVLARDGQGDRDARALAIAERLRGAAERGDQRLIMAGAKLVDAIRFERQGRFEMAAPHALAALEEFTAACVRDDGQPTPEGCDHRIAWRARQILSLNALRLGVRVDAQAQLEAAMRVARQAGDTYREALSLALLAGLQAQGGELERAVVNLEQARQLARGLPGADDLLVRLKISEARLASARGKSRESIEHLLQARTRAENAGLERTQAMVQANLSDEWIRAGRPEEALVAAEFALPVALAHQESRSERVVRHNIVLARLALGQLEPARRELENVLALWHASGAPGDEAIALREFADALAAAGDAKTALALYHRERELSAEIARLNRDSVLRELRTSNDQAAKQREIELLRKEAEVQEAQLANRGLLQSLWALAAFGMLLALLGLGLLVGRVRRARARLVRRRARLRTQSERDALTGLANRHYALGQVRVRGLMQQYAGALLVLDIDHFKRINDDHGHAVGDAVLVEVAARLADVLRDEDLAVRWGGEEFLVIAPTLPAARTALLAERIRRSVGRTAVRFGAGAIEVTVSVGHAHFPLRRRSSGVQDAPPLGWERALNLVDLLLYAAKARGRNSTVGIESIEATDEAALVAIEREFGAACLDGRVQLSATGPAARGIGAVPTPAMA